MIKMPIERMIELLKEKSQLSEQDINTRIEQKMAALSGLVSREGAATIVANELGVKLVDQIQGKLKIGNVLMGMRDVEITGKVQRVSPITEFQRKDGARGKVASIVLADETGSIRVALWGSHADTASLISPNMIVKIDSGYVRENNNGIEIHVNEKSKVELNPEGQSIGEVAPQVMKRKPIGELRDQESDVELVGTIVQVFEPRFFEVCPECGKRMRQRDQEFFCEAHNTVKPQYAYVMNAVLDDSTGTIRAVCFRKQVIELLQIPEASIMEYREKPQAFEEMKTKLLGTVIKTHGRVKKNEMFDRLEFVANGVEVWPDPKLELERLKQSSPEASADRQASPVSGQPAPQQPPAGKPLEVLPSIEEI
ncbi:DUF2240 family protein [Candidatus Woesearchaeota archaeon]|nr:DUF2240 family protein [Candidatus Woesearchaeota archaeon]